MTETQPIKVATNKKPCGGVVSTDQNGKVIKRYACEVHLFDSGVCEWQKITNAQWNG